MNRHVLTSYHGVHSDHQQFQRDAVKTGIKVVVGIILVWAFTTLFLCIGR